MSFSHLDHTPGQAFCPSDVGDKPADDDGDRPASPASCSLASLSLDPHKDALHSPAVNTISNDDQMRARIALEYYNKRNGTNYELACALVSNCFKSDGTWVHCNFEACQPNGDSSRRLFFAEMLGDDVTTCTWTVTACIVLKGYTPVGCSSCSEVIHPTFGFRQGHQKPKYAFEQIKYSPAHEDKSRHTDSSLLPPTSYSPTMIPYNRSTSPIIPCSHIQVYRERAKMALEYYKKEKGESYDVVAVLAGKSLSSGAWFHFNFTAKLPDGDISHKFFFSEIDTKTKTVTACIILEGRETTGVCYLCPGEEVIHPNHGFSKGLDKNEV